MATKVLFNTVVNWFIRQRMDQIQNFVKHPIETQKGILFSQLFKAEETVYGKEYGFKNISSYQDFCNQVPIVTYEDFEPYIERARKGEKDVIWSGYIRKFAKSSGTTNAKSKFIPISDESLEGCHFKAGKDLVSIYANNHPENTLFQYKNLRLGGSSELYEDFNTKFGDLSAILIENLPFWVEITTTPSKKTSLMSEWETKLKAIVSEVRQEDVGSLTGVPSWMMVLLQRILKETGKGSISELWPNLEVFFHGGISFKPYREQYKELVGKDINYYEIYNASEGFFGIQDRSDSDEMLLMLDYGIFYEFIPMEHFSETNLKAIPLEEVEVGKNYAVVITTNGGLWRYLIGDTVRFTSTDPYRIKISGRTKHYINAFGEELMIDNAEMALQKACEATAAKITDYTAAPIFMKGNESGAHEWVIEFSQAPNDMATFEKVFDETLKSINSDYEAKRYNDMTLKKPVINIARANLFYDWLESRGKLGGQNKVPRLSNDREYIDPILKMNTQNEN
ncbi:GH3 auxin-responsive promoter family protein [Riemerella anatipestifer]|uniref:GH3 auxin-responsive promoter family protein n=1 Tax=Riemerella anatipestifer TaxID=34085 RepID=UPI0001F0E015|nr:GH3 auxin-responsive promoter family protein [Riemerella anatipestifer]ADZ12493.1 auxin-regulated protein [Riemerella anatipestifer RA-GD]AKP69236.1 auxin-regulated protein [Riemerella anatipestifer]AKQ40266.1 CF4-like protein [Riemerella anatipestifer Yb2]EFT36214.1 putative auxin-regulated protein [Riemerella anatipestifer RA-YM]MBT0526767.1 GH3 auxin-responsive promoter family protein [Riemerella anatipestifer]